MHVTQNLYYSVYANAPILYVVDAKMYWRRIYEMDI